jgi:hypothetical protein
MSGQSNSPASIDIASTLAPVQNLLGTDNYTIWLAYLELYRRDMIFHNLMVEGLTQYYPMLNHTNISTLHYHILLVTGNFKYREVHNRADYLRLRDAFDIVLRGETLQDKILFDYMLEAHKELIGRI